MADDALMEQLIGKEGWFSPYIPDTLGAKLGTGVFALALIALIAGWVTSRVLTRVAQRTLDATGYADWAKAMTRRRVFRYLSCAAPLLVVMSNVGFLPLETDLTELLTRLFQAAGMLFGFMAINGALLAWQDIRSESTTTEVRSIKGYLQLARLLVWAVCVIIVISIMTGRSPLLMLSGLGALSAVLLLVFKDTLLSLVASTQMTANDMLRIGDWIDMPQAGADGFVIDMALHTVKVRNWDNTVTTIPTYKLFSESYRNWRYMFESGGRRIKRTLRLDAASIRFLSDQEVADLQRFALLKDYLAQKEHELKESNQQLGDLAHVPGNRRRLTNIGTFRAYALAYLKSRSDLHPDMVTMVRMMEPGSEGVPIEIYCFTKTTAWIDYEAIQGSIFDHFLAILPELSLRLYQAPSGADFTQAWHGRIEMASQVAGPPPLNTSAGSHGTVVSDVR